MVEMKKSILPLVFGAIFVLVLLVLNFLPGEKPKTDEEIYQEAYWEGYYDGQYDTEKNYSGIISEEKYNSRDVGYSCGYEEGYKKAVEDMREVISSEVARAYEAAMEVGLVHNLVYNDGSETLPTNEEYIQYVKNLYRFWDFFEQHEYERYLEYK